MNEKAAVRGQRRSLRSIRPTQVGIIPGRARAGRRHKCPPHVCGDHPPRSRRIAACSGSAPRMWGSPHKLPVQMLQIEIRPTYVGITRALILMCGSLRTSAPRMWGSPHNPARAENFQLIRPTYVGITPGRWSAMPSHSHPPHVCGDHPLGSLTVTLSPTYPPHVCGDHPQPQTAQSPGRQSAPRMWGSPGESRAVPAFAGIRPTYVGITRWTSTTGFICSDSPHVCGDHPHTPPA